MLAFSLGCSTKKIVTILFSVLYAHIHCFCAELAIYFVLHGASIKLYLVLHGTNKTIRCCILGGVYQMWVARP
jgi:hypothetical protein